MKQYETMELTFPCEVCPVGWAEVRPKVVFAWNGGEREIEGFYAAPGECTVRFLPLEAGSYTWRMQGAAHENGSFDVEPATTHGPVRAQGQQFVYADGHPFFPVGTTVYALVHQEDALVEETLRSLAAAPFNKVRLCVFPKHYDYNHNEPPLYPFEKKADGSWDVQSPCLAFWDRLEQILKRIFALDIQVDLILFHPYDRWGFDKLTQAENLAYLDYLLRRLAAYPGIWWSLANEYDLCHAKTIEDWHAIESFVADHDPYRHLLSCHNFGAFYGEDRPQCTHASLQVKNLALLPEYSRRFGQRPIVIDETGYEGNLTASWGNLSGQEMLARFWQASTVGAACTHGETFKPADSDIVWWARGGRLKGESIERIRFLRLIFEEILAKHGPLVYDPDFLGRITSDPQSPQWQAQPDTQTFVSALLKQEPADLLIFAISHRQYKGRCTDQVFLTYYDRQCCAFDTLALPEEHTYTVELLDTWAMTRTVIVRGAHGETPITLPGKPGMAVLCTKE